MRRRDFFKRVAASGAGGFLLPMPGMGAREAPADTRAFWVEALVRIGGPVLEKLAAGTLRSRMPVERKPGTKDDRVRYSHLEAFGRTMAGMAPWLELGADETAEGKLRGRYAGLARQALRQALDPASPDYLHPDAGGQTLVDAAFLAHAYLRAPTVLWGDLDAETRSRFAAFLMAMRPYRPGYNNWLLFSAMVEAALYKMGEAHDPMRVDLAVRKHQEWYVGDGHYGDGPEFHWDYYNSFVIQPMLLDVLRTMAPTNPKFLEPALRRQELIAQRYGEVQERLIAPDGTYPPIGRSIAYRFGAFQLLAQLALQNLLPPSLPPGQVRSGLSAVLDRTLRAPSMFDSEGWLTLGLYGHQPDLAESYVSTGSLYLCTTVFLPLGLSPGHAFWTDEAKDWTAKQIWSGAQVANDSALKNEVLSE